MSDKDIDKEQGRTKAERRVDDQKEKDAHNIRVEMRTEEEGLQLSSFFLLLSFRHDTLGFSITA